MTIVQLQYIIALDTYRNFLLAAEKCFVTQPTLSMQILKLEDDLGVKLFDRSKQPVIPTEIGAEIIEQARTVITETSKIKELISNRKGELEGELKIGVIPTIVPYLLPKVIVSFMDKYPKVTLMIWEYTTEKIIHDLKSGLLDCGILSSPTEEQGLSETPLFYETFVAYISKSSELMKKKWLVPKDIKPDELWLLNEGHCMRNQVLNLCNQKKPTGALGKPFEYNTGSVETLKRMVDLNTGVTIIPELCLTDLSIAQLDHIRYFKSPEPTREISLATKKNFVKKRLIQALGKEIIDSVPKQMRTKKKKNVLEIYN